MRIQFPEIAGAQSYKHIPFQFIEKLSPSQVFLRLPDGFSSLERMVLQSTGNLQRLLSAYYNAPSRVDIVKNELVPCNAFKDSTSMSDSDTVQDTDQKGHLGHAHFDVQCQRKIIMYFGDTLAYEAESTVVVTDPDTLELLTKHKYGLGQVFSQLKITPQFTLLSVGRHSAAPGSSFWRDYTLSSPGVIDCFIREIFIPGLFEPYVHTTDRNGTVWYAAP